MTKYIFITGGVVSSLGKGLTAGALGLILKELGLRIKLQKFDPYLNVDPGTMNPYQHGEVYVTDDGTETDLDLGHYERFTDEPTDFDSNYTAGWIYNEVINAERKGDFLGGTIQVIPHITNKIKECIKSAGKDDVDVVISEIGGTIGDIESLPFVEAIRQFAIDVGRENVCYIHLTLVPYIKAAGEIKTKPTQHSVGRLREIGIIPDILIARTEKDLSLEIKQKISLFCNVPLDSVIQEKDVDYSIYEVPFVLMEEGLHKQVAKYLHLPARRPTLKAWKDIIEVIKNAKGTIPIAVVGKYAELQDAYKSIYEAITHGGLTTGYNIELKKVYAEEVEKNGAEKELRDVAGILVPGGFGARGLNGKILAIQYARENKIPFFGICLGMQIAVIEFARNILNMQNADTTEQNPETEFPLISLLEEQQKIKKMGATMRLGAYKCKIEKDTKAYQAYGKEIIEERHRHRYEFNNKFKKQLEEAGMIFSGLEPDRDLVEIVELKDHPWFLACQFHPEFKSRPTKAHPLFRDFANAALKRARAGF
ncbi:MAG: CTP synthase [Verrucomicrobiota bacterium]|nr:CTP synthase [Verrucomicrobiota bacterium]